MTMWLLLVVFVLFPGSAVELHYEGPEPDFFQLCNSKTKSSLPIRVISASKIPTRAVTEKKRWNNEKIYGITRRYSERIQESGWNAGLELDVRIFGFANDGVSAKYEENVVAKKSARTVQGYIKIRQDTLYEHVDICDRLLAAYFEKDYLNGTLFDADYILVGRHRGMRVDATITEVEETDEDVSTREAQLEARIEICIKGNLNINGGFKSGTSATKSTRNVRVDFWSNVRGGFDTPDTMEGLQAVIAQLNSYAEKFGNKTMPTKYAIAKLETVRKCQKLNDNPTTTTHRLTAGQAQIDTRLLANLDAQTGEIHDFLQDLEKFRLCFPTGQIARSATGIAQFQIEALNFREDLIQTFTNLPKEKSMKDQFDEIAAKYSQNENSADSMEIIMKQQADKNNTLVLFRRLLKSNINCVPAETPEYLLQGNKRLRLLVVNTTSPLSGQTFDRYIRKTELLCSTSENNEDCYIADCGVIPHHGLCNGYTEETMKIVDRSGKTRIIDIHSMEMHEYPSCNEFRDFINLQVELVKENRIDEQQVLEILHWHKKDASRRYGMKKTFVRSKRECRRLLRHDARVQKLYKYGPRNNQSSRFRFLYGR